MLLIIKLSTGSKSILTPELDLTPNPMNTNKTTLSSFIINTNLRIRVIGSNLDITANNPLLFLQLVRILLQELLNLNEIKALFRPNDLSILEWTGIVMGFYIILNIVDMQQPDMIIITGANTQRIPQSG